MRRHFLASRVSICHHTTISLNWIPDKTSIIYTRSIHSAHCFIICLHLHHGLSYGRKTYYRWLVGSAALRCPREGWPVYLFLSTSSAHRTREEELEPRGVLGAVSQQEYCKGPFERMLPHRSLTLHRELEGHEPIDPYRSMTFNI